MIYEDYFADLNKQIVNYSAVSIDDYSLSFEITFAKPSDISTDINYLDYLEIEFLMPELIVDAENFKTLA